MKANLPWVAVVAFACAAGISGRGRIAAQTGDAVRVKPEWRVEGGGDEALTQPVTGIPFSAEAKKMEYGRDPKFGDFWMRQQNFIFMRDRLGRARIEQMPTIDYKGVVVIPKQVKVIDPWLRCVFSWTEEDRTDAPRVAYADCGPEGAELVPRAPLEAITAQETAEMKLHPTEKMQFVNEPIGEKTIAGVETEGYRRMQIIPFEGEPTVRRSWGERWYAQSLQQILMTTNGDRRGFGGYYQDNMTDFLVTKIVPGEPAAAFSPPAGYRIKKAGKVGVR